MLPMMSITASTPVQTDGELPHDPAASAPAKHTFLHKEVYPPTGVTHACSGVFTAAAAAKEARPDIIIVRATRLELWRVRQTRDGAHHLEEVAAERLWGVVQSLSVLPPRNKRLGRDALLLTFRSAKLSVLQWDDGSEGFRTAGLHCWEGEHGLQGGRCHFPMGPRVVADPQGRCAAVLLYGRHVALLPAAGSDAMDLDEDDDEGQTAVDLLAAALLPSRVIDLSELGIQQVRDLTFLHGYNEPTLLILHEDDQPTWAGRLVERSDTCAVTAVSLTPTTGDRTRIWGASRLPSDAQSVAAVPAGGCLVTCSDFLLFHTQGHSCALAISSKASAGVDPPELEMKEMVEPPAVTAAKHASRFCDNVPPAAVAEVAKTAPRAEGIDVRMLDCAVAWLEPRTALIGCASGQLLVATLPLEGGSVRRIQLSKATSGAPASALAAVGNGLAFLGSWLADSLLLQITKTAGQAPLLLKDIDETDIYNERATGSRAGPTHPVRPAKRQQADDSYTDSEAEELQALFDIGEGDSDVMNAAPKLSLKAGDALPGLGPIRALMSAPPPSRLLTTEPTDAAEGGPPLAVAAVGSGKRGGLASLRSGVVPLLALEPIPVRGSSGLWTVHESGSPASAHHAFLLISSPKATRVMDGRGGALDELVATNEGFNLKSPTVAAANLQPEGARGAAGPIVQVCPKEVRLLTAGAAVQVLSLPLLLPREADRDDEALVVDAAHVAGCYVALRLVDGSAIVLHLPPGSQQLQVLKAARQPLTLRPAIDFPAAVTAIYLAEDRSGWLTSHGHTITDLSSGACTTKTDPWQQDTAEAMDVGEPASSRDTSVPAAAFPSSSTPISPTEMPFPVATDADKGAGSAASHEGHSNSKGSDGAALVDKPTTPSEEAATFSKLQQATPGLTEQALSGDGSMGSSPPATAAAGTSGHAPSGPPAVFACVARAGGVFEMYCLPDMRLVLSANGLPYKAPLLAMPSPGSCGGAEETEDEGFPDLSVKELLIETLSPHAHAGSCSDSSGGDGAGAAPHLMAILSDETVVVYRAFLPPQGGLTFRRQSLQLGGCGAPSEAAAAELPGGRQMTCFDAIGESRRYWGVFVGGSQAMWLVADRGRLLPHPAVVDGPVSAFTPFHNATCERGFITAVGSSVATSTLRICQLDPLARLDTPWPLSRLPQRATVTSVGYYPEGHLHILGASRLAPFKPWRPLEAAGDATAAGAYAAAEATARAANSSEYGEVRLLEPSSGKIAAHYGLEAGEVVLAAIAVQLADRSASGRTHPLVAVGTCFSAGEDFPCAGRLLLFEVKPVEKATTTPPASEASWTMPLLFVREFRGPVTALAAVEGSIAVAAGARLEVHALTGATLEQTAFHDAPFLVTAVQSYGGYLLTGDASHGMAFFHYHSGKQELQQLARDWEKSRIQGVDAMTDGAVLHFAGFGGREGVLLQRHDTEAPHVAQTGGGPRLLDLAYVNLGHEVTATARERVAPQQPPPLRTGLLMGTDGGGLVAMAPLGTSNQQPLATLAALGSALALGVPHCCGLNPLSFRRQQRKDKAVAGRCGAGLVLDGDLLGLFSNLSNAQQAHIAQLAGVTLEAANEAMPYLFRGLSMF